MDLLSVFAEVCPDDIYNAIDPMDKHNLACTHRSIQTIVDQRDKWQEQKAAEQRHNLPQERIDKAIDKISHAWTALQTEDPALLERLRGTALVKFKTIARKFVSLSQRRNLPPVYKHETRITNDDVDDYIVYVNHRSVTLCLMFISQMYIKIQFEYNKPPSAFISSIEIKYTPRNSAMSAQWDKSIALAVAIVTRIFGVDMANIRTSLDSDYLDPDVNAYIESFA